MPALLEHLSFDKMKTNAMVNKQNLVDVSANYKLAASVLCFALPIPRLS